MGGTTPPTAPYNYAIDYTIFGSTKLAYKYFILLNLLSLSIGIPAIPKQYSKYVSLFAFNINSFEAYEILKFIDEEKYVICINER